MYSVRLGCIEVDFADVADRLANGLSNFADGDVFAAADVDMGKHGLDVLAVVRLVKVHDMDIGGGHVVNVKKFAPRWPSAQYDDARRIIGWPRGSDGSTPE